MVQVLWLVLGGAAFVAALFAGRSRRAMYVARAALGALYLGAGALVNAIFLATGVDYADFADSAHIGYVHDTWRSVVAPDQDVFITLLVIFEVLVGVLILSGGRRTQAGLWGAIAMHIGLLPFGWILTGWSVLMLTTFVLLLRAERHPVPHPAPVVDVPATAG